VIHQCGEGPEGSGEDFKALSEAREALSPEQKTRYHVQAYVGDEIGDVYALASLVVGRAGAGTVNEIANLGKPSVLIPLPGAAGGEQEANARALEAHAGAVVLLQSDLSPDHLVELVCRLISDPHKLAAMRAGALTLSTAGAADLIVDELMRLAGSKGLGARG
jgi:UDP-N-acetylglucosamine--N-acetylmuramyl-(pentapeptide) pyrophosphoryl-undecaprenol N-acetylglucosamine transferase